MDRSELVHGVHDLELINLGLISRLLFLAGYLLVELGADVSVRDGLGGVFAVETDEVVAKLGLDGTANLANLHLEAGGVEFGHHLAATEVAKSATLSGRGAGGVCLCGILKGNLACMDGGEQLGCLLLGIHENVAGIDGLSAALPQHLQATRAS